MGTSKRAARWIGSLWGAAVAIGVASALMAAGSGRLAPAAPPIGGEAAPIVLKDLSGVTVETARLAPRPLVLIFGELNHDGTRRACGDVLDVLDDSRLAGCGALPVLIAGEDATLAQLSEKASQGRFPPVILHDAKRDAAGAYHVVMIPTVVVVDGDGRVVHAMPGFLQRFREILREAVRVAAGKASGEVFARTAAAKSQSTSPAIGRAERLARLGTELVRRGLYELAEARFGEAATLAPELAGLKLGRGELLLRRDRLDEAEKQFEAALASEPGLVEAALGLGECRLRRGGPGVRGLEGAAVLAEGVLKDDPGCARAHRLMGRVREARGDSAGALEDYKKAADAVLGPAPDR